jgi:hypothetical protein
MTDKPDNPKTRGNVTISADSGEEIRAKLILAPLQKILVWAIIAFIALGLSTAGTVAVMLAVQQTHSEQIKSNTNQLHEVAVILEGLTTTIEEWGKNVNFSDRYTSKNAEADRLLNAAERNKLSTRIDEIRIQLAHHLEEFSDHRANNGHSSTEAKLESVDARLKLLEELFRTSQKRDRDPS